MTETLTTIRWRALDRDGEDKCRLAQLGDGYMLIGHARFRDGAGWAALDYVVRIGADWKTLSADVTGRHGGDDVAVKLVRSGADWTLNGTAQPQLYGCEDVDFAFTPATNLMPLRRLPDVGRLTTQAAWLRCPGPPGSMVVTLSQSYTRERGQLVAYKAEETGTCQQLVVGPDGFVMTYPGLWEADG
ncbi:putative glycolipid-binding domain-containing protein [Citreicella sp. C3M06]|uniref:putative glycolipid-binding domain-containing protein n=1 Tax=Roseobacteraceae TaxID=2854170 RepID=UPI001C0913DB|nr:MULTISPECIES: putative glycolipid-binding domain-containing protein [Roseobacteraceae]MBU2963606.1 putative glycolipid-binding domain-containing protein [Citreicella sp. C3M06]MDO6584107.1 putative glycolipid-binding domain-containing protein [Salipiger sp. 1_MG-2023]